MSYADKDRDLKSLLAEALELSGKKTLTPDESKRLNQVMATAKSVKSRISAGEQIDAFTGKFGDRSDTVETVDGFKPGIGRVSAKSLKEAIDGNKASGSKAVVASGSLLTRRLRGRRAEVRSPCLRPVVVLAIRLVAFIPGSSAGARRPIAHQSLRPSSL